MISERVFEIIWYAIAYVFESFVCFLFFENIYERRLSKPQTFAAYAVSFAVQYLISFFGIPPLNMLVFAVLNFAIGILCYGAKPKSCGFMAVILTFFMFITEAAVMFTSTYIFLIPFSSYEDNLFILAVQSSISKLLFFVVVFFVSKLIEGKQARNSESKYAFMLCLLPLASIANLCVIFQWSYENTTPSAVNLALAICSALLIFANVFVFYVYERVQKTNSELTKMRLESQREEISHEYYELLAKEFEDSRIIIHDIKKHLGHIEAKAESGDMEGAQSYIKEICEDFWPQSKIRFSGNKLIDVVLNRHKAKCDLSGIKLYIESCGCNLEFMSDTDKTALLDNLFENAVEAAEKSAKKEIEFSMYRQGDYTVITLTNSCDRAPRANGLELISGKKDGGVHGLGTKSIKRVAEKYAGNFDWSFNRTENEFKAVVVLNNRI